MEKTKINMKSGTPELLCGLSLCCNVGGKVSSETFHGQHKRQTTKRASERRAEEVET